MVLVIFNVVYLITRCSSEESFGSSREYFTAQYRALGMMSICEKWALALFLSALVLSFARPLYSTYLPELKPAYVFISCGVLSFMVSSHGRRLVTWKIAQGKIAWRMMYVFAGGLAVGSLIKTTGAALALGQLMASYAPSSVMIIFVGILVFTMLMSNVTSNTATAAVSIPIVIALASGMSVDALPLIYVTCIGMNLAYLFPTSIRAIPVGYGLDPRFMLRHGLPLTLGCLIIMTVTAYLLDLIWW